MARVLSLTYRQVDQRVAYLAKDIAIAKAAGRLDFDTVFGVPRGGCVPAVMLAMRLGADLVETPTRTSLIVDDLIDSGDTARHYPSNPFVVLYAKPWSPQVCEVEPMRIGAVWVQFPWELDDDDDAQRVALRLLQVLGHGGTDEEMRARADALVSQARP